MALQGPHMPITESSGFIPRAPVIDEEGAVRTLA